VDRALDKLQAILKKRGVVSSSATLGMLLSAQTITAAPLGLAAAVTAGSLAAAAAAGSGSAAAAIMGTWMAMNNLKAAVLCIVAMGGIATVMLHEKANRLETELATHRNIAAEFPRLRAESERLRIERSASEEIARLRAGPAEMALLQERKERLQAELGRRQLTQPASSSAGQATNSTTELAVAQMMVAQTWGAALLRYAQEHEQKLPEHLHDVVPLLAEEDRGMQAEAAALGMNAEDFEIAIVGTVPESHREDCILLRSQKTFRDDQGGFRRAYVFADGSARIHSTPTGDFEVFERAHGIAR